jgi:hypothetical protein
MTHLKCRKQLLRNAVLSYEENTEIGCVPRGWDNNSEIQIKRLEVKPQFRVSNTDGKEKNNSAIARSITWSV